MDGAGALCTVTLVAAAGSCSAPLNTVGPHTLTASYVATPNFLASASAPATVTVTAAGPVTATPIPALRDGALAALALMLLMLAGMRLRARTTRG
jgi:hypothetical protein